MANIVSTQYVNTVVVEEAHAAAVEAAESVISELSQSDWAESDPTASSFIKNKPTIPAAQVNADWNASSGVAEILHKPTIPAAQVNADWNATSGVAQILNKPTIPDTTSYVLIEQDILDDVSDTTYHTSIERAGDAGLRIDSQSYPADNPDGPSADSFVQVTATMTEIGAAHFSGPVQPGQSNIISQNYLEVDAGGTTLFTNKEHGPYPHLFVATEKGNQPILNELSLRDSDVEAPGFGESVEVTFEHDSIEGVFIPGANAIEITANNEESGPPVGLRTSYGVTNSGAPAMSVQNPDGSWTMFGTYTAAESSLMAAQITHRGANNAGSRVIFGRDGKIYSYPQSTTTPATLDPAHELVIAQSAVAVDAQAEVTVTDSPLNGRTVNYQHDYRGKGPTSDSPQFLPGNNSIRIPQDNGYINVHYGMTESAAPAMSVYNSDGSMAMFSAYSELDDVDIGVDGAKLQAQITARDSTNTGARILLGDNGKAYYKANAANNSVTVADELLTAGHLTASGVSVPIVPTDGADAGKLLLLTPGADPVYSLLPQFIEQSVYRLHSTDEFSALVHLTDDDDNPLLKIALIAGEDFPEYLSVLSSLSNDQLDAIECVYSDRTENDFANLEPLTQSSGPNDVQSVVNWRWSRLSDYNDYNTPDLAGSVAYEYVAPLVLKTNSKYMAEAGNAGDPDNLFATKFFHRWTDFIANLVERLAYTERS